jgi:hypothetical protein
MRYLITVAACLHLWHWLAVAGCSKLSMVRGLASFIEYTQDTHHQNDHARSSSFWPRPHLMSEV